MTRFVKGGQKGWYHTDSDQGYFHTYDSIELGNEEPHKIHMFLPSDYEHSTERYPVIYLKDGHAVFGDTGRYGVGSWKVSETLANLYRKKLTKKVIACAIIPNDRCREYTHKKWYHDKGGGGVYTYGAWICLHLKKWLDENYRTKKEEGAIIGSSLGGLASFLIGYTYPNEFRCIGSLSPAYGAGIDNQRYYGSYDPWYKIRDSLLIEVTRSGLQKPFTERPKLFLSWGLRRNGGYHNEVMEDQCAVRGEEMADLLREEFGFIQDRDLFQFKDPIGGHEEIAWAYQFQLFMIQFYPYKK
jgi:pimeloyl-ACP methyl ester carboxylesterase